MGAAVRFVQFAQDDPLPIAVLQPLLEDLQGGSCSAFLQGSLQAKLEVTGTIRE